MSQFLPVVVIPENYRFSLITKFYPNGSPILQACVLGCENGELKLAPMKQAGKVQAIQNIVVDPLFINKVIGKGTIIYFENGISTKFHTTAVLHPKIILSNYE